MIKYCDGKHEHKEVEISNFKEFSKMSDLFKVFADTTRLKILYVLFENEVCVCDISKIIGSEQSLVSHQLKVLKDANLVKSRRSGKAIYYSLSDNHVKTIFAQAKDHIEE